MKIKKLLAKPGAWSQGWLAYDAKGNDTFSLSPDACCWCLIGAVFRCYEGDKREAVLNSIRQITGENIPKWNDDLARTHAEVLALVT